jgi:hypothetical protein
MTPIEHWRTLDKKGEVMPWYTRPCLEWLETIDLKGKRVFEFGCGQSTIWYRNQWCEVDGVDSNPIWANGQLVKDTKDGYLNAIQGLYDIIVIDGDYRDECTEVALKHLRKYGYLIADNWEQPSVGDDWTLTKKLTKDLSCEIFKEPDHEDWKTAVWQNI